MVHRHHADHAGSDAEAADAGSEPDAGSERDAGIDASAGTGGSAPDGGTAAGSSSSSCGCAVPGRAPASRGWALGLLSLLGLAFARRKAR